MNVNEKQPITLLQDLVRIRSYSGEEAQIRDFIAAQFQEAGLEPQLVGENLVLTLPGADRSRLLIFNSHMDTVHVDNPEKWTHDPYGGEIDNGRIFGRGTSDMKIGLAASVVTALHLSQQTDRPYDVMFTYVVNEEIDGSGTMDFASWFTGQLQSGYEEIAAIFTEPTSLKTVEYGHRGNFFIKAEIDGDAGHASRPHEINTHTILRMTEFINDTQIAQKKWAEVYGDSEFAPPTVTPTSIEAKSSSPNRVSSRTVATFDLRTVPGFHREAFDHLRLLAQKRGVKLSLLYPDAPTGYTDPQASIIGTIRSLVPDLKLEVSQGSADQGFLTHIGIKGVIFGPGEKAQGHTDDESAPVADLERAIELYNQLFYTWGQQD